MPLSDIVQVTISTSTSPPSAPGFGTPLIMSTSAAWTERTRKYNSLTDVVADFATSTYEYKMAAQLFGQKKRPPVIMIGRCANKPLQNFKILVSSVKNSTSYVVTVGGTKFTFVSDASATNDEIATGLALAIVGVTGFTANVAGSPGSKYVTITANAAGNWTSVLLGDVGLLELLSTTTDPGVVEDLTNIAAEDNSWYVPVTPFGSAAIISAIAAYVESALKLFTPTSQDTQIETHAEGTSASDIGHTLDAAGYTRTALWYHRAGGEFLDCAVDGRLLPTDPGSETWKFKELAGVTAFAYTPTQLSNMRAKNVNFYYEVAPSKKITAEGKVADGEYIDIIRGKDWLEADMATRVIAVLTDQANDKISFDDPGIQTIAAAMRASLKQGQQQKLLATSPVPTVKVPLAKDVAPADKAARRLPGCEFTATLAGAIHGPVTIVGTLSF